MSIERYVRKSDGLISYTIRFYFHGRRYLRGLGPVSLKAAKLAERQARVEAAEGRFDAPEVQRPIQTLKSYVETFLASYRVDARPQSVTTYVSRINNHLEPLLGNYRLDQITAGVIDEYKVTRRREGGAPRTINAELTTLSAILSKAVDRGDLPAALRAKSAYLRTEERNLRVLTDAEVDRLLFGATPRLRPLIKFALQTGLRRQELLNLTWADIDWTRREVVIVGTGAKSRHRRAVPLNRSAQQVLRELEGQTARHGRVFGYKSIRSAFHQAILKAGLTGVSCHSLRRTFATRCLEHGINLRTVQRWLGHSDIKTTEKYLNPSSEHEKEAIELIDTPLTQHRASPSA